MLKSFNNLPDARPFVRPDPAIAMEHKFAKSHERLSGLLLQYL